MFRKEAITAKRHKIHGDVFLVQPLSFHLFSFFLIALVCALLVFLLTGTYARNENVAGHLVPRNGLVKVHAAEAGTLKSIHAIEGQEIRQGDRLLVIVSAVIDRQDSSRVARALDAIAAQETILSSQLMIESNRSANALSSLKAEAEELSLRRQSLERQVDLQSQISKSAESAYRRSTALAIKGYLSQQHVEGEKQSWLEQAARQELLEEQLQAVQGRHKQLAIKMRELPLEHEKALAGLQNRRAELAIRRSELHREAGYTLRSPVDGKVVSISAGNTGHSIYQGQTLVTIFPRDSLLSAELFVPSRAIGFVKKGQELRLLYDAFPYEHFGSYPAVITDISGTVLSAQELIAPFPINEPVYRVRARLLQQGAIGGSHELLLQTGMTLRANIILERRSFFDWVLAPLHAQRQGS